MTVSGYAKDDVLVSADWARAHLDDPSVRFVEVDVDTTAYDQSHIPGAVGWNWTSQLSDGVRRDIATQAEFSALLSKSGIGPDTTVVLYGDNNNWFAAWAYWQLQLYGHTNARLINGGRKFWLDNNLPLSTDVPAYPETGYALPEADSALRAFRDDILPASGTRASRSWTSAPRRVQRRGHRPSRHDRDRAAGGSHPGRRVDPVGPAGPRGRHVQERRGADGPVRRQGRRGRRRHHRVLPDRGAVVAVVVRAARLLGFSRVRNYDGSWTEWGSMVGVPIEVSQPVAVA